MIAIFQTRPETDFPGARPAGAFIAPDFQRALRRIAKFRSLPRDLVAWMQAVEVRNVAMLILRVVRPAPLHGYAIASRIRQLSSEQLSVEEGSLYPALQKALANGWLKAEWTTSDTGRQVRSYRITSKGLKQLETEQDDYQRMADAIAAILQHG